MLYILALITSFIAMVCACSSYFVKKKELYLFLQFICIIFLISSQFLSLQYFSAVGLVIALARTVTFYAYEKKGVVAPIFWSFVFAGLSIASYFIIDLWILKDARFVDVLCLVAFICYAFVFRIRDLKFVRFGMLLPTFLSVTYFIITKAPIFTILSYSFEFCANITSIFKYHVFKHKQIESDISNIKIKEN